MIKDILEKVDNLPPPPQTIKVIESFRNKSNKDADDLLFIIEKDALIVSTLLKVANSAMFNFRSKIETPKRIIGLLGINFTIFIAINETIQNILNTNLEPYEINEEDFRKASNLSSSLVKLWLNEIDSNLKEEIMLPALLQEIGKVILSELLTVKNKAVEFNNLINNNLEILEAEKQLLGTSTSKVTAEIFRHWKLSESLINSIEFVDDIENCKPEFKQKAQILDVIKTACNIKDLLTSNSIEKAINKASMYNLDVNSLKTAIETLKQDISNN